jgi:aldose sugar dehydrogenase
MKKALLIISLLFFHLGISQPPITSGPDWTVVNLANNNSFLKPNTMLYGPNGHLWVTEREGKLVRVNTSNGTKTEMLDLTSNVLQTSGQDGLMGMSIHPDLYININTNVNNFVYLLYTYDGNPGPGVSLKFRMARYTYNATTQGLNSSSATTIIDGIDAGPDHNSGKIVIGSDLKIYWTIGDFGANRVVFACNEIRSQYLPTSPTDYSNYKGKILRLNLDGSIPIDNPVLNGVKSHVYSYGHRNAQGIVFGSNGKLYASEHGDKTDDELNIIESGKNYGWPLIAGYNDNSGYAYCNWSNHPSSCGSYSANIIDCPGQPIDESTSAASMPNFMPPIGTYNSTLALEPTNPSSSAWPTVAPSSIDIYEVGKIPGWGTSLLIPTLKGGMILRAKLNADGSALEDGTYEKFYSSSGRIRDIALNPDGVTIYAITDAGAIIKINYVGTVLSDSEIEANKFYVLPNPATNEVLIGNKLNLNNDISVVFYDTHGRTIKKSENIMNNTQIDVSNFSNGLYFVKISDGNKISVTKKLIIRN